MRKSKIASQPAPPTKPPFSDSGALNPIPEEAQVSSTGREEECPNPSDEPMTTGDPVIDTLTARLTSPNPNPKPGKVTQLVMLISQGGVPALLVKDRQYKRTPTPLCPWKPMVLPEGAQAHSPQRGLNPEKQKGPKEGVLTPPRKPRK